MKTFDIFGYSVAFKTRKASPAHFSAPGMLQSYQLSFPSAACLDRMKLRSRWERLRTVTVFEDEMSVKKDFIKNHKTFELRISLAVEDLYIAVFNKADKIFDK